MMSTMPYIQLSGKRGHGHRTVVDEATFKQYGHLSWYLGDTGYAMRKPNGVIVRLHRFVTEAPEGMVVDHLNGDKLDNRRSNLRITTQAINAANRKDTIGYTWDASKNRWMVRYRKQFYGRYATEEEAKRAYQLACSGVPYKKRGRQRYMLPKGVFYMKGNHPKGKPYYTSKQINGKKYFGGYFSTVKEAEIAYNKILDKEDN